MNTIFSLLYTSIRPDSVLECIQRWISRATRPELIEFVLVHDSGDALTKTAMLNASTKSTLGIWPCKVSVHEQPSLPGTCVKGWNLAAEKSRGHVMICISDDFFPCQSWDHALMNLPGVGPRWASVEAVVRVYDGYVRDLCTLPIVTRRRYDKMGDVLPAGYLSMFVDTELTNRALMDGVLLDAPHLLFEHQHCDNKKRGRDAVDEEHGGEHRYKQGELLFNSRRAQGFPIDTGKNAHHYRVPSSGLMDRYAAFVQVDRPEHLQWGSLLSLYNDGVRTFFFVAPSTTWTGSPINPELTAQMGQVVERISKLDGTRAVTHTLPIEGFFQSASTPAMVETCFCNSALDIIRESGMYHVLLVSGAWSPGMAARIDRLAAAKNPMAIKHGDSTVYVRADARFADRWTTYPCSTRWLGELYASVPPRRNFAFADTV